MNELFYADHNYLIGKTADKQLIRNIKRSKTKSDWRELGKQLGNTEKVSFIIPAKNKRQAERTFGLKTKRLS